MQRPKIYLVSISSGKDSLAALLFCIRRYGRDRVRGYFADTGWEHPDVTAYLTTSSKKAA